MPDVSALSGPGLAMASIEMGPNYAGLKPYADMADLVAYDHEMCAYVVRQGVQIYSANGVTVVALRDPSLPPGTCSFVPVAGVALAGQ